MADGTFATVLTCMDGRVHAPVNEWVKKKFGVDFVDTITEPGADVLLTESLIWQSNKIKSRVQVSVERHGSRNMVVVGHHDCAGNPVSPEKHKELIKRSVAEVATWNFPIRVVGVWVGDDWKPEIICDTAAD